MKSTAPAVESVVREARLALRALLRSPGFTLVAVIPIALALGVGTFMFSLVEGVLLKALPYSHPSELFDVRVTQPNEKDRWGLTVHDGQLSSAAVDALASQGTTIAALASYGNALQTLRTADGAVRLQSAIVSPNLFDILGTHAALGRLFLPDDLPAHDVVVLSAHLWRERFAGAADIVGRSITINDQPYTVVGVAADDFYFPGRETAFWTVGQRNRDEVLARLKPGISSAAAEAEATAIAAEADARTSAPGEAATSGPGQVRLVTILDHTTGSVRRALFVLMAASLVLLLVASANVAGLLLVRSMRKSRERAVRAALGASAWRLARETLFENALIGLSGGLLGLALASGLHRWQALFIPLDLPRRDDVTLDWHVILFSGMASLGVAVLASLIPVWRAARPDLRTMMQGVPGSAIAGARRKGRDWMQAGLLVGQIGLSCALLIASGLLVRSFLNLTAVDPGYSAGGVLTAQIGFPSSMSQADRRDFSAHLLDRLHSTPAVVSAGVTSSLPLEGFEATYTLDDGKGPRIRMALRIVSPGYLQTIGARILSGRRVRRRRHSNQPARRSRQRDIRAPLLRGPFRDWRAAPGHGEAKPKTIIGLVNDIHDEGSAATHRAHDVHAVCPGGAEHAARSRRRRRPDHGRSGGIRVRRSAASRARWTTAFLSTGSRRWRAP